MKRYIVAVSGLAGADEKAFLEFIRSHGCSWWHWIDNFWLLNDPEDKLSAAEIRTLLREMDATRRCLVFENPSHETWAGFGPKRPDRNMFEWIKKNWP